MRKQLRYLEIAHILREKIKNGTFAQGESLPSQKELSEMFETSIMTARQALAVLEEEGIISIIHGVGTFVEAPGLHSDVIRLQGFQNEMGRRKLKISTSIVEKKYTVENQELNKVFNNGDQKFSILIRKRILDGKPVILQKSWISDEYRTVIEEYTEEKSLYQFFTEKTSMMITLGREIVSPVIIGETDLKMFDLNEACAGFRSFRISISIDERVVLYDEAYMPGPYVVMASSRYGRHNQFKYIINKGGSGNPLENFSNPELWEDLH